MSGKCKLKEFSAFSPQRLVLQTHNSGEGHPWRHAGSKCQLLLLGKRVLSSLSPHPLPHYACIVADAGTRFGLVWPSSWIKIPKKAGSVLKASLLRRAQRSFSVVPAALFLNYNRPYKQVGLIVVENKGLSF